MNKLNRTWDKFKYKYLSLVLLSFVFAAILGGNDGFRELVRSAESLEYIGAFIAGLLFVSSFTIATSAVIIAILAQDLNPLALALIGGVGSVIGDIILFRVVKDHLSDELASLISRQERSHLKHFIHTPYIAWMLPIIGALIIASPLPDELGVSLLGLSKISETKLIAISYISNVLGILAIASVVKVF